LNPHKTDDFKINTTTSVAGRRGLQSPLKFWVRIPVMARYTQNNIM
jgi:hypothetical protein